MRCYEFEFIVTNPEVTFESMSYDMADIFVTLEENPFITSCDMFNVAHGTGVRMLIITEILTISEIEEILLAKFNEAGRDGSGYILLTPDGETV
jgi:hypothetical protein